MVAILLFFVKQYNKLRWRVCYKEIDVSAIDTVAYITDIIPIHITSWHHGSRFFRVVSNGKALFVKVATNRDIGKREIEFYNKIQVIVALLITSQKMDQKKRILYNGL